MMAASFSLSLPRLGWKSTSMPRSLKICTAAGDSASEMSTLGFVMVVTFEYRECLPGRSANWREEPGSILPDGGYGSRLALRLAGTTDARELRRLRKLRLGFGKGPVDPLGEQRNIIGFDRGAAPDAQARRRVAMAREVIAGAFLFDQTDHLLDEVDLRIRFQRGDRRIGHLHAHRGVGADRRRRGQEIDPGRLRLPVLEHL